MTSMSQTSRHNESAITVSWMTAAGACRERQTAAFCIGIDARGELSMDDQQVTRALTAVFRRDGQWWVRDLGNTDGILLNGAPFQSAPLQPRAMLAFGSSGLQVMLEVEESASPGRR